MHAFATQCGNGYLEQDEQYKQFIDRMAELGIDVIYLHTSGHADYETFKMLFDITKTDIAIPIHTEDKYKISEFTNNVAILEDGETLVIKKNGEYEIIPDNTKNSRRTIVGVRPEQDRKNLM